MNSTDKATLSKSGCIGCNKCLDSCPMELDIPTLMRAYDRLAEGNVGECVRQLRMLPCRGLPECCVSCSRCIRVCPQKIDIPPIMNKLYRAMKNYKEN